RILFSGEKKQKNLVVEIDTEELYFYLCFEHAAPSQHHICQVDLIAEEDRESFFSSQMGQARISRYQMSSRVPDMQSLEIKQGQSNILRNCCASLVALFRRGHKERE